jgi:hypothetical protein
MSCCEEQLVSFTFACERCGQSETRHYGAGTGGRVPKFCRSCIQSRAIELKRERRHLKLGAPVTVWTLELIERLRADWPKHSATNLAATYGLTRNSIIGKAHRLGLCKPRLSPEAAKIRRQESVKRCRAKMASLRPPSRFARPTFLPEKMARERILAVPESEWVPFLHDLRTCRAIMSADNRCCGRKIHYRSYCEGHAAIYYHKTARQLG